MYTFMSWECAPRVAGREAEERTVERAGTPKGWRRSDRAIFYQRPA